MHNERARQNGKIRIAEFRIIARPIFCFRKNDSAQDFAALHLGGLFFLLRRLGMEWALGLRLVAFRCSRRERTMIRDRDPRANRNRNNCKARRDVHISFGLRGHVRAFESGDMSPHSK